MAQHAPDDVPPPADALGFLGILVALAGVLLVAVRLAWLAWQTWAWWSGLVFIGAGIALFLAAAVGTWLYTTGIPMARYHWAEWKHQVRERRKERQRQQEQQAQEGDD